MLSVLCFLLAPVLSVDVAAPTADKPQSKIWFAQGSWWAWLPVRGGSSVWRRGAGGEWARQSALDADLAGWPGRADVWADARADARADEDRACAVLVGERRLAFACLQWRGDGYALARPVVEIPVDGKLETATLARDGRGGWWIAYGLGREMWVRRSADGWRWAERVSATPAAEDDLCAIVAVGQGVGVIWSDQAADTVWFRWRKDGAAGWRPIEAIEQGGRNADDHIRASLSVDGRLLVAMKNSVDRIGSPQLVLRERSRAGRWKSLPYAPRTATGEPTRPVVLLGGQPERRFLLHSRYTKAGSEIVRWEGDREELLLPVKGLNDITGPKARFPDGQLWIVLASDRDGNVYEARLN